MQIDPNALPDAALLLQPMPRAVLHQRGEVEAENDNLRLLTQCLMRAGSAAGQST